MKTFTEIFEELARHNDRSVIWNDWLDYAIEINELNLSDEKKPFRKNYHGNEPAYWDMTTAWLNELTVKLEKYPYYDLLGEFYEELVTSQVKSSQMGQFFSPVSVSELVNNIVSNDIQDHDLNGKIANDPACGSARMLLSAHVKSKGELICLGEELDPTAARMAVLNFYSHGVRGSILQIDTLTREFHNGWRVNRYLYNGIPIPHIEEINSENEALDFIELNNNDDGESEPEIVVEEAESKKVNIEASSTQKTTGQTTLI